MDAQEGGTPAWLFSFVDLAFLLLIAMTQLAGDVGSAKAPDLGEMIVPNIGEKSARGELSSEASRVWQLRIHPRGNPLYAGETLGGAEDPFELIYPDDDASDRVDSTSAGSQTAARADEDALARRLDEILLSGAAKPLLIPHEDSRSQDLLDAVSLLEERWPSRRRALVARNPER